MEKVVFTALTKQDLEALVIDCVQVCLKRHAAQQPAQPDAIPGVASPLYASKRESARILGCSQGTLDNYRRAGKLKAYKLGKSVKFLRNDILALAKSYTSKQ